VGVDGSVPVALVLSTGSMASFRLVFPEPEGKPRTRIINGYEVLMEEHFNGEQYAIFLHPDDDERRVALRVITRGRSPDDTPQPWKRHEFDTYPRIPQDRAPAVL